MAPSVLERQPWICVTEFTARKKQTPLTGASKTPAGFSEASQGERIIKILSLRPYPSPGIHKPVLSAFQS
jgi:hypothetical protein